MGSVIGHGLKAEFKTTNNSEIGTFITVEEFSSSFDKFDSILPKVQKGETKRKFWMAKVSFKERRMVFSFLR